MPLTLASPRLVTVHGWGRAEDGALYLVLEYVNGRSLKAILAEEGALPMERAVALGTALAAALDGLHGAGLVHGDVRPEHVLVLRDNADETIKLKGLEAAGLLLHTGVIADGVGPAAPAEMPEYLTPEEISGGPTTSRTDIYRYGLILYAMLTGFPAFSAATPEALQRRQLGESPLPPRALRGDIGPVTQAQLLRALEKDPERRPSRAGDILGGDLVQALDEYGPEAVPGLWGALRRMVERLADGVEWLESGRRHWMLMALAAWLVVSVAIVWLLAGRPFASRTTLPGGSVVQAPAQAGPTAEREPPPLPAPPATPVEPAAAVGSEGAGEPALAPHADVKPPAQRTPSGASTAQGSGRADGPPVPARVPPARTAGGPATPSKIAPPAGVEPLRRPAPEPRKGDRQRSVPVPPTEEPAVPADGTPIIDWLFRSSPR
jgi:serine/threonine-protein kinase